MRARKTGLLLILQALRAGPLLIDLLPETLDLTGGLLQGGAIRLRGRQAEALLLLSGREGVGIPLVEDIRVDVSGREFLLPG